MRPPTATSRHSAVTSGAPPKAVVEYLRLMYFLTNSEPEVGIAPTTYCLQNSCSAAELLRLFDLLGKLFKLTLSIPVFGIKLKNSFKRSAGILFIPCLQIYISKAYVQ